jgi:hypothetical protein
VETALEQEIRSASTQAEAEDAEAAREALWTALDSGALGVLLAGPSLWILIRSHMLFLLTLLPLLRFLSGRTEILRPFLLGVLRALTILACGVFLNALLRYWCSRLNATFSPAFFLHGFDGRRLSDQLAIHFDLFLIAYIVRVAFIASKMAREGFLTFIGLFVVVWLGLNLAAFLLGFHFELSF